MNLLEFPLLTDENIHPDVVDYLRSQGQDVQTVIEAGLGGQPDTVVLNFAHQAERVVMTHDSDFGGLTVAQGKSFVGIIYLRPGHIQPDFTIQTIEAVRQQSIDVESPFIVIAVRREENVRIRVRQL